MSDALLSGVSGMSAAQKMLDVTGNNLANLDTTAFKSSRVAFADLLSETLSPASSPVATIGGTNPQQIGSGVKVASIDRNMAQGSLVNTGQPLDMAIDGNGYFVLNDGKREVYTRAGSFAVDANYFLVDPGTGNRVQRIGSAGVAEGFQDVSNNNIRIPYDVALPAKATETLSYTGNLSADDASPTTNMLTSVTQYTKDGAVVSDQTLLNELDQATNLSQDGKLTISGTTRDGTVVNNVTFDMYDSVGKKWKTVSDLLTAINAAYPGSTASIVNGEIRLTDNASGYSQTDMKLSYSGTTGSMVLPKNFKVLSAGGTAVKTTSVEIYDSQGIGHTVSAAFVKTDKVNTWDMVVTAASGDVELVNRRIKGITFQSDGSYAGLSGSATPTFSLIYGFDPTNTRTVNVNLGTIGGFDGLSQFGGSSTAAVSGQDGYAAGYLSSLSVTREGVLVGVFTNGVRRDIAALKVATFQNPAGLESTGGNYFAPSANSGDPVPTQAMAGGAGGVTGGSLEKSNVDVSVEFVNLIQAQNGYQANARTIRVANDMLQQLANIFR